MAAPASQGQSDNSMGILWGIAAVFVFAAIIWWFFSPQIKHVYLSVKLFEIGILNKLFGDKYQDIANLIRYYLVNPGSRSLKDVVDAGTLVGNLIRYPFVVILFILAIVVYAANTTRVFRNTYSMKDLAQLECPNWPQISPVIGLDLVKQDIDKGPWAMALSPMQYCKRYNLLQEVKPERRQGMARHEWDKIDVILKRGEANQLFIMQLGPLWRGPDKLPPYAKALFAAFAARINADSAGVKLLLQLAASSRGKLNYSGVDALLKKHYKTKLVQEVVNNHAYVFTVMSSMLERARDDGVQASADFLWLKPLDRRLWYTLNTVGRQTPFIEVGGIFAHWVAEKEAQRKLVVPMVEQATNAVELALKDVVYRRDE